MIRTCHLISRVLAIASLLVGSCALAIPAAGQASPDLHRDCSAYASVPLPTEADQAAVPKSSPACASYRSYRGLGRQVNYSEARACAWEERLAQQKDFRQNQQEPTAWVVGGSLILADIYFNGAGVKRNVPLAMRLACESEEGMAKLAMPVIEKLNGAPSPHPPFEFCDYAATTLSMNFCSSYVSQIEDERRSRYYVSLKRSMTPEQGAAFEKLLAAHKAYVKAHALEVYQGGTIRNVRTIRSQGILEDLFRAEVAHLERKQWPRLTASQITAADSLLHREYLMKLQQLQKQTKEEIDNGSTTASQLSEVQKAWEAYRDAWVSFAGLRYADSAAAIRAKVTLDRYRLLKTIR